ncbi:hypothetical protein [Cupriavidus sp. AcVe19-6a]|uniref:hypothetical protein n=1 Tax=Cupriavidus sp. AcVe19-6a TaxID=2821358 RepID=UPI001AEAE02F|nr:hypothetical protein [Cupriavidus sp. AcVe19-6a]MBP0639571.1 hypothetical protein [Cupriavidus sp. AcVe19-6a]
MRHDSISRCVECGAAFWRDADWKIRCLDCWRARKAAQAEPTPRSVLADENERLRVLCALLPDAATVRRLLQLCHPDRHGNSDASNAATVYLLRLRDELEELERR